MSNPKMDPAHPDINMLVMGSRSYSSENMLHQSPTSGIKK